MNGNDKIRFQRLLEKYRNNSLSDEEYQIFITMLNSGKESVSESLNSLSASDWEDSLEILKNIRQHESAMNQNHKTPMIKWMWGSVAAVFLLGFVWAFWPKTLSEELIYQTDFGEIQNIELPDGSKVLLNANSQISWKGGKEDYKTRKVELTGEAFFDVMHIDEIPFRVFTAGVQVEVIGTEFNVKDRGAETEVFLHQGKVNLKLSDKQDEVEMEPGDLVKYDSRGENLKVEKNHQLQKQATWIEGMLDFQNKPLKLILQEFGLLYGKEFKIEDEELAKKRMDFSLPYTDWELVKIALEIAIDAEFIETNDSIIIK